LFNAEDLIARAVSYLLQVAAARRRCEHCRYGQPLNLLKEYIFNVAQGAEEGNALAVTLLEQIKALIDNV
jgi:hypothetical protein